MQLENKGSTMLESSLELRRWVEKSEKSAIYETIFGFAIFFLFGFLMYNKSNNLWWLLLDIAVLLFFLSLYTYGGTTRRARVINSTVKSIVVTKESILFTTFPYSILGIKSVPEQVIEQTLDKLVIKECDYPIMDKKTIQGKVMSVSSNQKDYYILPQFFPEEIKKHLTK